MKKTQLRVEPLTEPSFLNEQRRLGRLVCALMGGRITFGESTMAVHKFLLIEGGVLIVGPYRSHRDLFAAGIEAGHCHEDDRLEAAGDIGRDGRIIGWQSEGYRFTTPPEIRPEVEEAVEGLIAGDVEHRLLPLPA